MAQLPAFTFQSVTSGDFEEDYEDYLTDQFVMRDSWITLRTAAERASLKQEVHDIYFAHDDYLIEKHTGVFNSVQAERNAAFLSTFAKQYAAELGEDHLTIMLIPNAVRILADKLPAMASPYDEELYLDELRASVSPQVWFDALSVLAAHADEEIYYHTDHHWKTLGAFYVFKQWAEDYGLGTVNAADYEVRTVTDDFEGTVSSRIGISTVKDSIQIYEPVRPVDYVLTYNETDDVRSSVYQPYVLDGKDKYSYFLGGNYALIQAEMAAGTGRRLLVIKDSYAHCFAPFLFDRFDQVDLLDLRYFNSSLSDFIRAHAYTDILFLQNAAGFAEDASMSKLIS